MNFKLEDENILKTEEKHQENDESLNDNQYPNSIFDNEESENILPNPEKRKYTLNPTKLNSNNNFSSL